MISAICRATSREVQIVCSTGIACDVFKELSCFHLKPTTVHSVFGIGTEQAPFNCLVSKAVANPAVRRRVQEVDCVVWDECSMSSARQSKLFHTIAQGIRNSKKPFGGIQTIIVGDWLQLKPVADRFDDGIAMFKSPLFRYVVPHTVRLSVLKRLNLGEDAFQNVLSELRNGRCSAATAQWVCDNLQRAVTGQTVHLHFTNILVDGHNAIALASQPGKNSTFTAVDTGKTHGLKCHAPEKAVFKPGVPVVCLYNINDKLHNGTRATFVCKIDEKRR